MYFNPIQARRARSARARRRFYQKKRRFLLHMRQSQTPRLVLSSILAITVLAVFSSLFNPLMASEAITFKKEVSPVEAGSDYSLYDMIDKIHYETESTPVCSTNLNINKAGSYTGACTIDGHQSQVDIQVVDTTAPKLEVQNLTVGVSDEVDAQSFVTELSDCSRCKLYILNPSMLINEPGSRMVQIRALDEYGNFTVRTALLTRK